MNESSYLFLFSFNLIVKILLGTNNVKCWSRRYEVSNYGQNYLNNFSLNTCFFKTYFTSYNFELWQLTCWKLTSHLRKHYQKKKS